MWINEKYKLKSSRTYFHFSMVQIIDQQRKPMGDAIYYDCVRQKFFKDCSILSFLLIECFPWQYKGSFCVFF